MSFDEIRALCDAVLEHDRRARIGSWETAREDELAIRAAAPQLARFAQAVFKALDEEEAVCDSQERGRGWRHIRAALTRQLEAIKP